MVTTGRAHCIHNCIIVYIYIYIYFFYFLPADNKDDDGFNLIQPSLIQQLRTILDQYPDDGQILKVRMATIRNLKFAAPDQSETNWTLGLSTTMTKSKAN